VPPTSDAGSRRPSSQADRAMRQQTVQHTLEELDLDPEEHAQVATA